LKPVHRPLEEILTPEGTTAMREHFLRLKEMFAQGRLLLAGPCDDEAFGIVIFKSSSLEEAEQLAVEDPAVVAGLMTVETHEFHVAVGRGLVNV
jgi:uncharacterized protein YciI